MKLEGKGSGGRGGGKWGERGREEGIGYLPCPPPQSKPLMKLKTFATVHNLMKYMNVIDSCQAHLPVQCPLNVKFIRQK